MKEEKTDQSWNKSSFYQNYGTAKLIEELMERIKCLKELGHNRCRWVNCWDWGKGVNECDI